MFHLCMVITSMYLAMMASAWYMGDYTVRPSAIAINTNAFTSWVFTISSWIAALLFLYVLIIPLINTSRDYS